MEKNHKLVLLGLAVVLLVAMLLTGFFLYSKKHAISEETRLAFSNTPGEEPYTDMVGNPVSLESHLGKILVVATWASWSPFSAADLAMLDSMALEYDSAEVVFMAVNRRETKEQAARFMATQPSFSNIILVLDPRDNFYSVVGGYAMPEVLVYDEAGEVVLHERGVTNAESIKQAIDQVRAR